MLPAFFFVIGFILYLFLVGLVVLICIPLHFLQSKKLFARKAIGIALISFPCLIIVTLILTVLLAFPGAVFLLIVYGVNLNHTVKHDIVMAGLFFFILIVGLSSLYFWYFSSQLIVNYVDKKPLSDIYKNDKVYQLVAHLLRKSKIFNIGAKNNF